MAKTNVLKMQAPAKKPVPQTAAEASQALGDLGLEMAERARLEAALNSEIADITTKHTPAIQQHLEKENALFEGLQAWAEANRKDLCKGDSKTVQLGTGEVGWRLGQEKVSFKNGKLVISLLKAKKVLKEWVRTKEEVDKDAILKAKKDPKMAKFFTCLSKVAGIDGLKVEQDERFRAQPMNVDAEKIAS